ncbi:MAG TPA: terminase family protein [Tissierellaceae bacterium]|nr:terminase family protein [Tissierellaceae bacterium]
METAEGNTIEVILNRPHEGQQTFLDSPKRFKVLMCGRRWGKSDISKNLSIDYMLNSKSVAYITPSYQLAKVFYEDVLLILPNELIKSKNKSDLVIELITGGSLSFFTGEKPDALRGRKFHLVIIDEASYVKDLKNAWNNAIRPTLTDYRGDAIFISTPRGKDFFNSLFDRGQNKEEKEWESFRFTSYENPYIDPAEIEMAKMELPENAFRQEYLAIPSENVANPFGMDNIQKNVIKKLSDKPSVIYGIDLAKTTDWSVIIGLDGDGNMSHYDRFQLDWTATKDKIRALPRSVVKHIDSTGVGDVIVEELQKEMSNIEGFKFTGSSKPQLILSLIKSIEEGKVKYTEDLVDELSVFEYKLGVSGHVKYEAMSGYHDDKVIALALANYLWKAKQQTGNWSIVVRRK